MRLGATGTPGPITLRASRKTCTMPLLTPRCLFDIGIRQQASPPVGALHPARGRCRRRRPKRCYWRPAPCAAARRGRGAGPSCGTAPAASLHPVASDQDRCVCLRNCAMCCRGAGLRSRSIVMHRTRSVFAFRTAPQKIDGSLHLVFHQNWFLSSVQGGLGPISTVAGQAQVQQQPLIS